MTSITRRGLFYAANLIGGLLLASGFTLPVYTDHAKATELKLNACDGASVVGGWYQELEALETLRHPLMQSGLSLILASFTGWWLWRTFQSNDGSSLKTPSKSWMFFALGIGLTGLLWFSQMVSLMIDLERGVFPSCADSIAIPMYYISFSTVLMLVICAAVGLLLTLGFKDLPVSLLSWDSNRPKRSALITFVFAILMLPLSLIGLLQMAGSAFLGTPAIFVAVFLLESSRSALIDGARSRTVA